MNVAKAKFLVVRRHWTQMGEERERERIIKLLEEMQVAAETNQSVLWVLENAKVLIKRGNK